MTTKPQSRTVLMTLLLILISVSGPASAGITIDAGLTPPEGRWIVRTQMRIMSREAAPEGMYTGSMNRTMVPVVIVHGMSQSLTLGLRQVYDSRSMTMNGMTTKKSGRGDLYLFAKYKILRINTRNYTLGIAPVFGVESPTGSADITSDYWDMYAGLYVSGRAGAWALDLNLGRFARGVMKVPTDATVEGDEFGVDLAFSRQIPVGNSGQIALAPVLELSWQNIDPVTPGLGASAANTGESVFSLAPGLKYTVGDLIFEGLVRFPVAQDQKGMQLEMKPMALLGVRYMF